MRKVLIIEDNGVDREIYKRCLQDSPTLQFDFAESSSAAVGIELSRNWVPDCILLDFNLPDMDGLEVLPRLRGDNERLPCAVVMLTACGGEELAVNAMKGGAMDYLPKGQVSAEVLPQRVLNAIERFQMMQRIDEQRSELTRSSRQHQILLEAIPQMVWMQTPMDAWNMRIADGSSIQAWESIPMTTGCTLTWSTLRTCYVLRQHGRKRGKRV